MLLFCPRFLRRAVQAPPRALSWCLIYFSHHYLSLCLSLLPSQSSLPTAPALCPHQPHPHPPYSASKRAPISQNLPARPRLPLCVSLRPPCPVTLCCSTIITLSLLLSLYLFSRCSSVKEMERIGPSPLPAAPVCLSVCRSALSYLLVSM